MSQKEIYEKCRLEASKKYRDEINALKYHNSLLISKLKELEDENKKLQHENLKLHSQLELLPKNPFVTKLLTEMNDIMKATY